MVIGYDPIAITFTLKSVNCEEYLYKRSILGSDIISDTAGPLRVISRSEWLAQPPEHELDDLELPATRVIIAHTATEDCSTQVMNEHQRGNEKSVYMRLMKTKYLNDFRLNAHFECVSRKRFT